MKNTRWNYCFLITALLLQIVFATQAADTFEKDTTIPKGQLININNNLDLSTDFNQYDRELIFEDKSVTLSTWKKVDTWQKANKIKKKDIKGSSSQVIYSQNDNVYKANTDSWLISPVIQLPKLTHKTSMIKLFFKESFEFESGYDFGYVKISKDNGLNWVILDSRSGKCATRNREIDLGSYAGKNILVAFQTLSDYSNNYAGWTIGDIEIILFEPQSLNAALVNLNPQSFPFIYMNVTADYFGSGLLNLSQNNFQVYENNTLQTNYFQVTPPTESGGSRITDIIFLMDNSGSMSDEQNAVRNNVLNFVNKLTTSGVNFALGLCRFGQYLNNGYPILEDYGQLTQDANYFKNTLWNRNGSGGGTEPGYTAIKNAANGFSFRPGAQKVFIIITDETPYQGTVTMTEALNVCRQNSITLFALTESDLYSDFQPITSATNGQIYDIYSNFDDIFDYIANLVSNTYLIRYYTNNPVPDGQERFVDVKISYNGYQAIVSGSYIPNSAPLITRTPATKNLHNQAWAENTDFVISAYIEDNVAPDVSRAELFFKNTNSSTYRSVFLTNVSGTLWQATISGSYVTTPGLDYYITATDGQATSSDPSVDPSSNPYQLAILPNYAPSITHTVPSIYSVSSTLTIDANITDNTNYLSQARLYYRRHGDLIYQNVIMNYSSNNHYQYTIPANFLTASGLEYYIKAVDDFGVCGYHGFPDQPHIIYPDYNSNVTRIEISGPTEVKENSSAKYICTAYYNNGTNRVVTNTTQWSDNSSLADIDNTGLLTVYWLDSDVSIKLYANFGGKTDNHSILLKNAVKTPKPILYLPENYATNVDLMPKLEWIGTEGATYWVTVADNTQFGNPVFNDTGVNSMYFNVPAWYLQPNTKYYWRVLARKDGIPSNWPESFYFNTADSVNPSRLFINNLLPENYEAVYLEKDEECYVDRDYILENIPDDLKNLLWIRTANEHRKNTSSTLVSFNLLVKAKIYLAYDSRILTKPNWLTSLFTKTNYTIKNSDPTNFIYDVWTRDLNPGIVQIGGNLSGGASGAASNYMILLEPILSPPPVADFDCSPKSGTKPLTVQFQNMSSGSITQWSWNFGDGQGSSLQNPSYTYNTAGQFSVSLTVTGPDGSNSNTKNNLIVVNEAPPVANFIADITTGNKPLSVQFTDNSTGVITSRLWNFGDGQTSTLQNPSHIFQNAGIYTVVLTVTGPGGLNTKTRDNYIVVSELAPTADFTASPTIGIKPLSVQFTDNSTGVITSRLWNFGDGQTSTLQNPSHIFQNAGIYTVVLTATGPGGSNTKTRDNYIVVTESAPVADFTASPTTGSKPLSVQFTDNSTGVITSRLWNFGDGQTSTLQNPPHIFQNAGTHTIYLTVTGPGGSNTKVRANYIIVTEPAPIADFTANPTTGNKPLSVQFTDNSIGVITSRLWNFGDGSASNEQNPLHTYTVADTFTVSLTVTGPGGVNTKTRTDYIKVQESALLADFVADVTEGLCPLSVQFTDQSQGNITTWLWNFGDGYVSTIQNPTHVYDFADSFSVSLTVSGSGGVNTKVSSNYIKVKDPTRINAFLSDEIPKEFCLYPNYPNPFNPQTTIRFALPCKSDVEIEIYNVNGTIVDRVFSGIKDTGYYTITWVASDFPSGLYFIKLRANQFTQIQKCTLVK